MRSTLLNYLLAPAVMTAAVFTTGAAMASTVTVPFSFTAANHECPAGTYTVKQDPLAPSIVTLQSQDGKQHFSWIVSTGSPDIKDQRTVLQFDQVGQTHVLATVQYGPRITSRLDRKLVGVERMPMQILPGR